MTDGYEKAMAVLPHGHPMILVDRVESIETGRRIVALKAITASEPCYGHITPDVAASHFAYPISLLIESFAQAAAILWLESRGGNSLRRAVFFVGMRGCTSEAPALPGDVLRHVACVDKMTQDAVVVSGETHSARGRVLEVLEMTARLAPEDADGSEAYGLQAVKGRL